MRFCTLLPLILSLSFIACESAKRDQYPEGGVRVKIPHWTESGYQLQVVDLLTVRDMNELEGGAAQFLLWPRVMGTKLTGNAPKIHTIRNAEGVYIAVDEFSLELLTTYYHMEKLKALDALVGVGEINTWPRQVAISNNVYDPVLGQIQNNALYSGQYDAILLMPYTQANLPMAVNGGILGHEHFHSLFQKIVINSLGKKFPQVSQTPTLHSSELTNKPITGRDFYHSYLLRGLNEGLADFWGWLYSEDNSFVGRSLAEYQQKRDLSQSLTEIPDQACFLRVLYRSNGKSTTLKAYELGTQVAVWQRDLALKIREKRGLTLQETRAVLGSATIRALKSYAQSFSQLSDEELIEPGRWIEILLNEIPGLEKELKDWSLKLKSDGCKRR